MTLLHRILNLPARVLYLSLFLVATGLLSFGLYLQHGLGLEPCPMCIMQRYAFATAALIALIAGLHAPGRGGERVYAALIGAVFILDDPIFNGLAISLIFGIFVSTILTLVVIPLLYFVLRQHDARKESAA